MKFYTAIIAVILFIGVFAVTDPEINSVVKRMENTRYGKTLLDTIAL